MGVQRNEKIETIYEGQTKEAWPSRLWLAHKKGLLLGHAVSLIV